MPINWLNACISPRNTLSTSCLSVRIFRGWWITGEIRPDGYSNVAIYLNNPKFPPMPLPTDHSSHSLLSVFTLSSGFGQTTINLKQSMNTLYLAVLLTAAFTGKKDTVITHYRLRYDH